MVEDPMQLAHLESQGSQTPSIEPRPYPTVQLVQKPVKSSHSVQFSGQTAQVGIPAGSVLLLYYPEGQALQV